jgi:hypothetical protein
MHQSDESKKQICSDFIDLPAKVVMFQQYTYYVDTGAGHATRNRSRPKKFVWPVLDKQVAAG